MACACLVMYAMAAIHLGLDIRQLFAYNKTSNIVKDAASDCVESIMSGKPCSDISVNSVTIIGQMEATAGHNYACSLTALLIVNVSVIHLKLQAH
jgi:hypothetical protein